LQKPFPDVFAHSDSVDVSTDIGVVGLSGDIVLDDDQLDCQPFHITQ
jgi:hypothetical protein